MSRQVVTTLYDWVASLNSRLRISFGNGPVVKHAAVEQTRRAVFTQWRKFAQKKEHQIPHMDF